MSQQLLMIPQEKKSCVVQTTFLAYSLIGGAEPFNNHDCQGLQLSFIKKSSRFSLILTGFFLLQPFFFWELTQLPESDDKQPG